MREVHENRGQAMTVILSPAYLRTEKEDQGKGTGPKKKTTMDIKYFV